MLNIGAYFRKCNFSNAENCFINVKKIPVVMLNNIVFGLEETVNLFKEVIAEKVKNLNSITSR